MSKQFLQNTALTTAAESLLSDVTPCEVQESCRPVCGMASTDLLLGVVELVGVEGNDANRPGTAFQSFHSCLDGDHLLVQHHAVLHAAGHAHLELSMDLATRYFAQWTLTLLTNR